MNERQQRAIRAALAEQCRDRFENGFADRAVARWRADQSVAGAAMARSFRRLSAIAAAAVVMLAAYNLGHRRSDRGQSVADALLGITPTAAQVVSLAQLYGLEE